MQKITKKRVLRKWVVKVLSFILFGWIMFCATTIDSIDLTTYTIYDKILVVWTILALVSFHLLSKYSNVFDYNYED
jgi:hypothetical protein